MKPNAPTPNIPPDRVDSALGLLRSEPWPGKDRTPSFQELIVNKSEHKAVSSRRVRRTAVLVGVGAVLVGGTVFAAAGGPSALRTLFRAELVTEDGTVIHFEGVAEGEVVTGDLPDGRTATLRMVPQGEQIQVEAAIEGGPGEATITATPTPTAPPAAAADTPK